MIKNYLLNILPRVPLLLAVCGGLLCSGSLRAQTEVTVTGIITAQEDNAPLPGVSVIVKGTSQEVPLGTRTSIDVVLVTDIETLSEVVVVAYGEQKRETLTGSVSQVKGSDLVKSPQTNVSNSLAGRFSGIIASNRGGEPGYDGTQPWFYLRYAEVLLNYAEAQNEVAGPDASVYDAINLIRQRADMPDLPAGLDRNGMRDAIRRERQVELALLAPHSPRGDSIVRRPPRSEPTLLAIVLSIPGAICFRD